jgi:hypothetical protein
MKPDTSTLLDELTGSNGESTDSLVRALRALRRRRAQRRSAAAGALGIVAAALGLRLVRESPAPHTAVEPAGSPMLSQNELLDSFGDQPVALITWPDGRQQLLAIARPPARDVRGASLHGGGSME